ncbi:MAG: endo-1,4-beta-xylanase [Planctomycetes bacterium]|nr:endo-1,4-beta-xylanase [Planctomycetota bacterium]
MLVFNVLLNGKPPAELDLDQMYLTSQEGQPIRARFRYMAESGRLFCERRSTGLAAVNLSWPLRSGSRPMIRTALLPDREEPYLLTMELARGRVSDVWRKKDEWGYVYGGPSPEIDKEFQDVKLLLAKAQTVEDAPLAASDLAEEALSRAIDLGEKMATADARQGIEIRRRRGELARVDFGCHWDVCDEPPQGKERFGETFNYATVPFLWRAIEPREHEYQWKWHDDWIHWLEARGIGIKGGSLVRFSEKFLPDWVWIWENDFETIRDSVFDHIERCVQRYRGRVDHWDAMTGLHVENCMNFSLDRIIEITRVCAHAVRRADPQATVVLDLVQPWGEYYATNQRSIWPYHYAEMCMNAGVQFDVVGVQFFFGTAGQGLHCRDMLNISNQLDRFGGLGKPVHVTAVGVPSSCDPDPGATVGGTAHASGAGGIWHKPWDEVIQSDWIDDFYRIAIAKPFVTAVSWRDFSDHKTHYFPHGGLLRSNGSPKIAYQRLMGVRQEIWPEGPAGGADSNVVWPES